jgi:hypothetical protein
MSSMVIGPRMAMTSQKGFELLDVDHATKRSRRKETRVARDRKCAGLADGSGNSGWQAVEDAQRLDGLLHLGAARGRAGCVH